MIIQKLGLHGYFDFGDFVQPIKTEAVLISYSHIKNDIENKVKSKVASSTAAWIDSRI